MKRMSTLILISLCFPHFVFAMKVTFKKAKKHDIERLLSAVTARNTDAVRAILEEKINPTIIYEPNGRSLLHMAIEYSVYDCALALVKAGAKQTTVKMVRSGEDTYSPYPHTPLLCLLNKIYEQKEEGFTATSVRNKDVLLYNLISGLIACGANVNDRIVTGFTALHMVSHSSIAQKIKIADALIMAGAKIGEKDSLGRTPIFNAVLSGDIEYVRFLLKQGASVLDSDTHRRTLLMVYLSERKYVSVDIPELLVSGGLDVKATDLKGRDAVWYAKEAARSSDFLGFLDRLKDMACSA